MERDVVVIGAGFAGLYAVHKLRDELGLSVQGYDAAGGPGGTWWWNRYPGARCDIESVHYSYSFSDEIQREWEWTEKFPAQPEILRYLEFVADKLDVRKEYAFETRVVSTVWDDATNRWTVTTGDGSTCTAQFVIAATGNLSIPKPPEFPGLEDFPGEVYHTSSWPHDGVDFTGKRVGVIGTGSTGIQIIPVVAEQADHLTVFQRTPNYASPLRNAPVEPLQRRWNADNHETIRKGSRNRFLGAPYPLPDPSAMAATEEERRAKYEALWAEGGVKILTSSYADLLSNEDSNETLAEFIREQIRAVVKDPEVAELLCPDDHAYGTKRPALETNYFETYNRDNVDLVSVRNTPIQEVTSTGIKTTEAEYDLDIIILATGFDAITGPLLKLGFVGRDGVRLEDKWVDGPTSYLGIAISGFPNVLTITGPQSAVVLYNNPLAVEDHVDFAAGAIKHVLDSGAETFETNEEAEQRWNELVSGILNMTLLPRANSWYMGANVPGKPRAAFLFAGGAPLYRAICADAVERGYQGFSVDGQDARGVPPMVRLDPGIALVVGATLQQELKPLDECTLEETREMIEGFALMQAPPRDVEVIETVYPGPEDDRPARIYLPNGDGPFPIVVFFHGGGFVAGSLNAADNLCRALADDLSAVVVSASYRLAPESPFPAATDDTYAAVCWAATAMPDHGGDPERLVVMGESAGGTLAAVAAQRARDEGGPELAAQVLVYPTIDVEADTNSRKEFASGPVLSTAGAVGMWAGYLGDLSNASSPLASPARAETLAGLPPALILTAECDPLRDEGEDYGRRLESAGVPVEVKRVRGMVHGAYNMAGVAPRVGEFNDAVGTFLESLRAKAAT